MLAPRQIICTHEGDHCSFLREGTDKDGHAMQEFKQIETSMNYLVSKDERPATYMYEPPAGTPGGLGIIPAIPCRFLMVGRLTNH